MLACVVAVVMLRPLAAEGAGQGSLTGVYNTYLGLVVKTDPSPTEVTGQSLCSCRYLCYVEAACPSFSFMKGQTEDENVCLIPAPDAEVKGYARKDRYVSLLKEPLADIIFTIGSVKYFIIKTTATFDDAPYFCSMRARIACPSDPDQYDKLMKYIQGSQSTSQFDYWVDVSYTGSGWVWGDGTRLTSTKGEFPWLYPNPTTQNPNDHGVMASASMHKLMTYPKDTKPYVMCQTPA